MQTSKTLSATVVVAVVMSGVAFVSTKIHEHELAESGAWLSLSAPDTRAAPDETSRTLSTEHPMAIDPRRMEAPAGESASASAKIARGNAR